MPRAAKIHPNMASDYRVARMSAEARLFYLFIMTQCNSRGEFKWRPRELAIKVLPWHQNDPADLLKEIVSAGLFERDGDIGRILGYRSGVVRIYRRYPEGQNPLRRAIGVKLRAALYAKFGRVCAYCSTIVGPFEIEHIVPVARGGTSQEDNLCISCRPCNRSKGAKLVEEWKP